MNVSLPDTIWCVESIVCAVRCFAYRESVLGRSQQGGVRVKLLVDVRVSDFLLIMCYAVRCFAYQESVLGRAQRGGVRVIR